MDAGTNVNDGDGVPLEAALATLDVADAEAVRAWLVPAVCALLATDRARLMAILYRVDVRERDLATALAVPDVAAALAEALLARMVEKQRYRRASSPGP